MKRQRTNAVHVSKPYGDSRQSTVDSSALKEKGESRRRRARSRKTTKGRSEQKAGWKPALQNASPKEIDAESVWKEVEDAVVPGLRLSVIDHVVYFHLLRHSRLEGKRKLKFSIPWLARNIRLSSCPTREAVRRLAERGALRLVERSKAGHVAEVRLPEEIRGVRAIGNRAREAARQPDATDIEDVNFLKTLELRRAIHARERGKCFYCLRRVAPRMESIDHVVPRARVGCNSYRNLVSACMECNSEKGERSAEEFLRWLFREHRLGAAELKGRVQALEMLACGKLRPTFPSECDN